MRPPIGTAVLVTALFIAALRQGGYHEWDHRVFAWMGVGAGLSLLAERTTHRALIVATAVMSPLMLSTLLSTALSIDRSDARSTILEVALVGIGLWAGAAVPKAHHDRVVDAVLGIGVLVATTAVIGVAFHTTPWGRITAGVWRGSSSLTYANAAAGVIGPTLLLALGRAAEQRSRLLGVVGTGLLIGLVSTQSRAGIAATVLVGVWLASKLDLQRVMQIAIPVAAGAMVGLPLLVVYASDDRARQPAPVLAAVALGLATTWLLSTKVRVRRPRAAVAVFLAATLAFVAVAATTTTLGDRLTLRSGTTAQGEDASVLFGDRAQEWSTAWDRVLEEPVVGHGPGVVDLRWVENGRSFRALFVHNEYLELAVTHGAVGLLALSASTVLFLRHRRRDITNWPVVATITAFLVHSGFDYLWHLPALPVLFGLLAGTMLETRPHSLR